MLAARKVGPSGAVHAFEPLPNIFELLSRNATSNSLCNISLNQCAVSDRTSLAELSIHPEAPMSYLKQDATIDEMLPAISVETISLDEYFNISGCTPDLIKVDVEGAERLVLAGAAELLSLPPGRAPDWIIEYAPQNCTRFGYAAEALIGMLHDYQYQTYWIGGEGVLEPTQSPPPWESSGNFAAVKHRPVL